MSRTKRRPRSDAAAPDATTESWQRVAADHELDRGMHRCSVAGQEILLTRADGEVRAFQGRCPHQGVLLAEGEIEDGVITCAGHGWKFDCATGQRVGHPDVALDRLRARVEDGEVWVDASSFAAENAAAESAGAEPTAAPPKPFDDMPGPKGWPLLGNAPQVDPEKLHLIFEGWAREYGSLVRLHLGRAPMVLVSDPDISQHILRNRPGQFRRPRRLAGVIEEIGGRSVFTAEGDEWRPQRKIAMHALSARAIKSFYPVLERSAARLLRRWQSFAESGESVDIQEDFKRFTVDVTTSLAFAIDMNTLESAEHGIQRHLELLFPAAGRRMVAPFPYWRLLRLPADRALDRSVREIRSFCLELITETRARLAAEPERAESPANFLEAMCAASDEHGVPYSDETVYANSLSMLLAGEDTTTNTLSWMMHYLCELPDVQQQLFDEAQAVLGDDDHLRDPARARELAYASAVTNESMRLMPVAAVDGIETNEDVTLGGYRIPAGTVLWMLRRPAGLDEARFEEAARFSPERWMKRPTKEQQIAFFPFGTGPRICPGRSLASLQMQLVTSMFARHFTVERVGERSAVKEVSSFTMMPEGLRVKLCARD